MPCGTPAVAELRLRAGRNPRGRLRSWCTPAPDAVGDLGPAPRPPAQQASGGMHSPPLLSPAWRLRSVPPAAALNAELLPAVAGRARPAVGFLQIRLRASPPAPRLTPAGSTRTGVTVGWVSRRGGVSTAQDPTRPRAVCSSGLLPSFLPPARPAAILLIHPAAAAGLAPAGQEAPARPARFPAPPPPPGAARWLVAHAGKRRCRGSDSDRKEQEAGGGSGPAAAESCPSPPPRRLL